MDTAYSLKFCTIEHPKLQIIFIQQSQAAIFKHFNSLHSKAQSNAPIRLWLCHFNWLVGLLKTKVVQGVNNFFCCMLINLFDYAFESNK